MDKYKFISECYKEVGKLCRYRHHITFISTYLRLNAIPKGFEVKFHNNWEDIDLSPVLKNCSKKLMARTVNTYRKRLLECRVQFEEKLNRSKALFPADFQFIFEKITRKSDSLSNILAVCC